ncbi:MAG: DUF4912 domain-containing protein [Sulfurimonas sp.]|uniref:DUF4912 domain-containing protein n=1 Tax=Sulfurimonas sp. TaxID=2022749 RepID=UPI0025E08F62|nr:DUF4912 domain-containing protein [Sulfurimonas sp.]MCK9454185.1 DUF4912 domain-containing protein [Sulfurimonas sp.]
MNFTDELIAQGLSHVCKSSNANVRDIKDEHKEPPKKYNKDKLVLLPINPNSSFVYWEVTDKRLEKFGIDLKNVELSFKLLDVNHLEILEFSSNFAIGSYYLNHKNSHKAIYVKLYLKVGERLEYILSSNIVGASDKGINNNSIYSSINLGGN